jgi:hypothetical protein
MLNVECWMLNVEWPAGSWPTRSFTIHHSTLNIQHSGIRAEVAPPPIDERLRLYQAIERIQSGCRRQESEMLNVECWMLNVEWPAGSWPTRSFTIQQSTLNIQHSGIRSRRRAAMTGPANA